LLDENRSTRRRALERLRKETVQNDALANDERDLFDFLLKPLLRAFSDPVEKCRELAIEIITKLCLSHPEQLSGSLALLLPVLVSRLGLEKIPEPSEELRLQLLHLLSSLVEVCSTEMTPYLDDVILILQHTIVDPYPESKKESCQCVLLVANAIPQVFYQQSNSLVKPLLQPMAHQRSKVRLAALQALGCVVRKGSATAIDDVLSPLAQRVSDCTPSVRSCLVDVLADWLLHQPDRYSYHHKLIPLLLICLSDEVPDISTKAHRLWEEIGAQFERENEEDLKDKMDFMQLIEAMPGLRKYWSVCCAPVFISHFKREVCVKKGWLIHGQISFLKLPNKQNCERKQTKNTYSQASQVFGRQDKV
jgi:dynein assembly factor 5